MILTLLWAFALITYTMSWVIEIELNKFQSEPFEMIHSTKIYSLIIFILFAMIAMGFYIKQGDLYPSSIFTGCFGIAFSSLLYIVMLIHMNRTPIPTASPYQLQANNEEKTPIGLINNPQCGPLNRSIHPNKNSYALIYRDNYVRLI